MMVKAEGSISTLQLRLGEVTRPQRYLKRLSKHIGSPGLIWSWATPNLPDEKMATGEWDIICQDTNC